MVDLNSMELLRVEDTDQARSTAESKQEILDGLSWLGIDWDEGPGKGGAKENEAATRIRTTEGKHVERRGKGEYKVMETGIVLTSDDPDAI